MYQVLGYEAKQRFISTYVSGLYRYVIFEIVKDY